MRVIVTSSIWENLSYFGSLAIHLATKPVWVVWKGPTYCWTILFVLKFRVWNVYWIWFYTSIESWRIEYLSFIFRKKTHSHKVKSKFSRWTNFPQHKLCLGDLRPHQWNSPFLFTLAFRPNASLGLTVTWRRKNKLINSDIQRGSWKFQGHLKWRMAFKIIAVNTFWE